MSWTPGGGETRFCASANEPTYGKLSLTHYMHRIELFSMPPDVHVCLLGFHIRVHAWVAGLRDLLSVLEYQHQ